MARAPGRSRARWLPGAGDRGADRRGPRVRAARRAGAPGPRARARQRLPLRRDRPAGRAFRGPRAPGRGGAAAPASRLDRAPARRQRSSPARISTRRLRRDSRYANGRSSTFSAISSITGRAPVPSPWRRKFDGARRGRGDQRLLPRVAEGDARPRALPSSCRRSPRASRDRSAAAPATRPRRRTARGPADRRG